MQDNEKYCSKEISWLRFNHRVLQEAADPNTPLIERLKFIGIFSSNQDEYFRVRVANLKRIAESPKNSKIVEPFFGHKPIKVLRDVQDVVLKQMDQFHEIYDDLIKSLAVEGIHLVDEKQLNASQQAYVEEYFLRNVRSNLVPIMLSQAEKFPELRDQSIYFVVVLKENKDDKGQYALLEVPTHVLERFVRLPNRDGQVHLIMLDDVVRACLNLVFPQMGRWKSDAYMLKISRDADLGLDDDLDESYISKISESLKRRRWGDPTRIIYDQEMPKDMVKYLLDVLNVDETDTLIPGGRYHNHRDFFDFPDSDRDDLCHPPRDPMLHHIFSKNESFFDILKKRDVLLHFPYHSFNPVIDMLREAAVDPKVRSISITIYRLAKNSKIINALISAAKNGKKVRVILELQARFDEKANLKWANILREDGVDVHFGVEGIKIHSKLCLITRRESGSEKLYAMLATGNFNEATAKVYTDHMLMTTRASITREVKQVFDFIGKPYQNRTFRTLLVSPLTMRPKITRLIEHEIAKAKAGKVAWIKLKLNNLADKEITDLLYEASCAGVDVQLVIRGMCSLVPGIEGVSENIEAVSIVDRLLEHSRMYIFCNGGRPLCYLSSADWMTRNLDYRVEVGFPVLDKKLKEQLLHVFDLQWRDNVKARKVDGKGKNKIVSRKGKSFRSQDETYEYIRSMEVEAKIESKAKK
jgi:polyphosphate kinase